MSSHLSDLFRLVLDASWQSSLIILLILLVRPLMWASIPARWRYGLWALVLIRLLVPISAFPPSPVSMQNIAVVNRPLDQVEFVLPQSREMEAPFEPLPNLVRQGSDTPAPASAPVLPPPTRAFSISWSWVASAIWLAGTLVSLGITISAHVMLRRRLGRNRGPIDPAVVAIWDKCCLRLGIKNRPALHMSPDMVSPALVGLAHPVLLLPERNLADFSPDDWENVFMHELAHYRRGDHWTHALQLVALAAHWFNPLVWVGFRQLRVDRELAADEWALQHLEPERSTAYGDTLLKVLAQSSHRNLSLASVGILEDRVQMKQRLQRIVSWRTLIGSLLGLGIVVAMAALVLGRQTEKADLSLYADLKPEEILVAAARHGDLPVVRKMIRDGVSPNATAQLGFDSSPLTAAAASDHLEVVRFLVSKGAEVNDASGKSSPALMAALAWGYPDCADYLLQHGAKCDPAILAAAHGDKPVLEQYLAQPALDAKALNKLCEVAAVNGHAEVFELLLDRLLQMPGQAYWHLWRNYVVQVVAHGHRDVAQILMDHGETFNKGGVTRLSWAFSQSPAMRAWMATKGYTAPDYTDGERLIDATEQEDLPEMARLLKAGANINYLSESSWTPLTKAAAENKARSIRFLLAHGADPNSVHLPGWDYTALCLTARPEIADMVLKAGGNINATLYKRGVHIMDYCVTFGPPEMVKWYLDHGVDPTKAKADDYNRTFLFDAAGPEIAELLIQHGVDVKARTNTGETALYWICMFGQKPAETARVLLKHGADPNARTDYGVTPLMVAKDGATVDVLVEYGADLKVKTKEGASLIQTSGNTADASRMEALIHHGVSFDPKQDGPTMLMSAAWRGQVNLMASLLAQGVDPNVKGCWNKEHNLYQTPLTAAVVDGQYDAAKLLVEHGAKIEEPDENGKPGMNEMLTALHNRRTGIIKLFWEHGDRSISELCYEVSQGAPVGELQKLLDAGSPTDPPQDKKITPLAIAAQLGNMDAVQLLVQHGADVNWGGILIPKNTEYRMLPLMMAAAEGQDEVVAYLLAHGAKPDLEALKEAANNSYPYQDQKPKEHFEKTVKLLIDAGALKNATPEKAGAALAAGMGTRQGPPNLVVVKMLLDAGLSPELPMPYAEFRGGKKTSIIGFYRDWYGKQKNDPSGRAEEIKPVLDLLEKADKK